MLGILFNLLAICGIIIMFSSAICLCILGVYIPVVFIMTIIEKIKEEKQNVRRKSNKSI